MNVDELASALLALDGIEQCELAIGFNPATGLMSFEAFTALGANEQFDRFNPATGLMSFEASKAFRMP